ncbi:MAG: response regulator, partial [Muribaculaceae bacterium]|nr:response regulator [Muribaculaceae bacterium]
AIDTRTGQGTPIFIKDENGVIPYIRDLMLSDQSEIWIASESGVYIYDIAKGILTDHLTHNYFDKFSLSDDAVYCLMPDRAGGIWIGSYFGGADYLNLRQPQFDKYFQNQKSTSLQAQRIRELCRDSNGIIYVGSEDRGLSAFNPATGSFTKVPGIEENNIHGLCIDGHNLWVGTFAKGLKIKNLDSGTIRHMRANNPSAPSRGLKSDYIFTMLRTLHGDIYIGTLSGLQRYNEKNDSIESIPELNDVFIYNLAEDSHGNLWVATYSNGLYMRKVGNDSWINFRADENSHNSLPSDKVYSVQEDTKHNVWIMTQNGPCVYRPESDSFDRTFMGLDRIPGMVYRMEQDYNGLYWLTSNHGIYCINSDNGSIRNYTTADGLPTNQFNYNSSLHTPEGKIYFGSIDGLVAFDPLRYSAPPATPSRPVISEIYLHNKLIKPCEPDSPLKGSVSLTESIEFDPDQNSFAIRIATLNFNNPGEQRIKYKLEGFDSDWRYTSLNQALLTYANMDYGTYHLMVGVCNDNDDTTGPMLDMKIRIKAPFYRTWWAFLIYTLIICTVIYVSFHYYRRYSRLNNQRYLEHYTREKERESFESKIKFFTNVAHEIRTPLTLIKAPLDCVFRSKAVAEDPDAKENLDVINLNVDRLLLLANQLLDFRKMESGKFQISKRDCDINALIESLIPRFKSTIESSGKRLDLRLPGTHIHAAVDSEAITKIISNLATNAIKYGKTYIRLELTGENGTFTIRMANDGDIVSPDKREEIFSLFTRLDNTSAHAPGAGIGLSYARSLAQMHGGTLTMDDSTSENVFVLTVPVGEPSETENDTRTEKDLEYMVRQNEDTVSVLLVEDNPEMLAFIEKKLIATNYRVLTATNGIEALTILGDQYVDIVVSDVMMPEMDGFELLTRIKSDINYSHIPVILLTAKTNMEDKLSGLEAGADAYIEKPFAVEYLLVTIGSLLRNRERMRRRLESMPLTKVSAKGLTKVDEEFLRKINEIIQSNFDNPEFSMEDVISALGMSRTTFYRKIKGMLDLNPNDYIKLQRLKRAAQLFQEGHISVSEVCYMVGFSSPGYFTKCFQKQFGVSPKEYIANLTKKTV